MKPCNRNRKPIAWMTAGVLDARQARELRAHFETCGHCRAYWNELSGVVGKLAAAETNPGIAASPAFHQKLAGKLRAVEAQSAGEVLSEYLTRMFTGWRIAIPMTAAVSVVVVVLTMAQHRPAVSPSTAVAVIKAESPRRVPEISPTIGNYEMAANESLDKLDELLTKQGNFNSTTAPVDTASMLKTPGTAD